MLLISLITNLSESQVILKDTKLYTRHTLIIEITFQKCMFNVEFKYEVGFSLSLMV
jgi:hypothetical protein